MKNARRIILVVLLLVACGWAADESRKIVHHEDPEYPQIAAKMSLHGTVKLKVWIAPDGSVRRLEYIGGHPLLAESAIKAVRLWKYERAEKETTDVVELKF